MNDATDRSFWLAEITLLAAHYPPGGTPAQPAPATPPPPATAKRARIVERYGERFCAVCGFPEAACGCDRTAPDAPAQDGAESSLNQRVRALRGGR